MYILFLELILFILLLNYGGSGDSSGKTLPGWQVKVQESS